jgi:hypothetical protein
MLPIHVALVSETPKVGASELSVVSAAIQAQVTRDFGPMWGVTATVDAFPSMTDVPRGSRPVRVQENIHAADAGYHQDEHNQPFALVKWGNGWSMTASHETLEMLADPTGHRLHPASSPADSTRKVMVGIEVCDPCSETSYLINGVRVSDFVTPLFYITPAVPSGRYSHTGQVTEPLTVIEGGYISFLDPADGRKYQWIWDTGTPRPRLKLIA